MTPFTASIPLGLLDPNEEYAPLWESMLADGYPHPLVSVTVMSVDALVSA